MSGTNTQPLAYKIPDANTPAFNTQTGQWNDNWYRFIIALYNRTGSASGNAINAPAIDGEFITSIIGLTVGYGKVTFASITGNISPSQLPSIPACNLLANPGA